MRNQETFGNRHKKPYKKRSGWSSSVVVLAAVIGGLSGALSQNVSVAQLLQPTVETTTGTPSETVADATPEKVADAASCNIKGNVSHKNGTKIYHVPGQIHYSITKISQNRGERWFCSEEDARANGWRKARN